MTEPAKDPKQYPVLRNLQFSPLREKDEKYVVLWDPTGLSTEKLIVPLNYFYVLQFFDGDHSLEEIGVQYLKRFGEFLMPDRLERLVADLDEKLFLEGERVEAAQRAALEAYRAAPVRAAAYAGKSYEADPEQLRLQIESFFSSKEGPPIQASANKGKPIKAIVAPHYELRLGGPVYAWAYKEVADAQPPDLFVILGTCHSGLEQAFAVTDKAFETPLGRVPVDRDVVEALRREAGERYFAEDVRHRHEHTIEFQLPFLQYVAGRTRPVVIVPVLCAFPPNCLFDPELRPLGDTVSAFLEALKKILTESGRQACVIASADLAHIGLRYGDPQPPTDFSFHRCLQTDLQMLKHVEQLDAEAFARFIHEEQDRRRICGFAPIYSMLKLISAEKGEVLRYDRGITDQFNSTVTYASMAFF